MPVSFGSASKATVHLGGTLSINAPAGLSSGDVMLAAMEVDGGSGVTITPPAGGLWTLLRRTDNGANCTLATYSRVAGASEAASWNWTFNNSPDAAGIIARYLGVDNNSPIDVSGGSANASSSNILAPSIVAGAGTGMVVGFWGQQANNPTITVPGSFTDRDGAGAAPVGEALRFGDFRSSPGATGTQTATSTAAALNNGQLISLNAGTAAPVLLIPQPPKPQPCKCCVKPGCGCPPFFRDGTGSFLPRAFTLTIAPASCPPFGAAVVCYPQVGGACTFYSFPGVGGTIFFATFFALRDVPGHFFCVVYTIGGTIAAADLWFDCATGFLLRYQNLVGGRQPCPNAVWSQSF